MFDISKLMTLLQGGSPAELIEALLPIEVEIESLTEAIQQYKTIRIFKAKDGSLVIQLKPIEEEKVEEKKEE